MSFTQEFRQIQIKFNLTRDDFSYLLEKHSQEFCINRFNSLIITAFYIQILQLSFPKYSTEIDKNEYLDSFYNHFLTYKSTTTL